MTFNSLHFLVFFPIVVLVYYGIPQKIRWIWLLICSYYFYMSWNPMYSILIIISTIISFAGGNIIESCNKDESRDRSRIKKGCLTVCILVVLSILGTFKYYSFIMDSFNFVIQRIGLKPVSTKLDLILPVGISFYTFQVIGYLIDVYRENTKAERNLFRYALFISFFPQLVAGPIERSYNFLGQIYKEHRFNKDKAVLGIFLMLWGFFKKIVIADRAAVIVKAVIASHVDYYGIQIVVAIVFFAIQIYCDFSGYTDIARGAAKILDYDLMKNFDSPFLSRSITEFWRRWHISLASWFRDYVYIPLGGNRNGRIKKYRNILITFALSGLWHGAGWNYIFWGGINGFYQVVEDMTKNVKKRLYTICHINPENIIYRGLQVIVTFTLFCVSLVFFGANSLMHALHIFSHSIKHFGMSTILDSTKSWGMFTFSLQEKDYYALLVSIAVLFIVDIVSTKINIRDFILKTNGVVKFIVIYLLIMMLIIFGYYGPEFDSATFIYFQF